MNDIFTYICICLHVHIPYTSLSWTPPMVAGPPCTFFSRWNQTPNNFLVIDKVTCHNSFCPRRHQYVIIQLPFCDSFVHTKHKRRQVVAVSSWRILHDVVATLTMTKIRIISTKIENDALLLATCIKNDMENTIVKEVK